MSCEMGLFAQWLFIVVNTLYKIFEFFFNIKAKCRRFFLFKNNYTNIFYIYYA